MSALLLVLIYVFQIEGSPCLQVGYDLEQMGKLHLWIELKHSFFLSAWSSQKSDSQVPSGLTRRMKEIVSWQGQESQNLGGFQKREINQTFGMAFLYLRGLWGIQPGTPDELLLSQLGGDLVLIFFFISSNVSSEFLELIFLLYFLQSVTFARVLC